MPLAYGLIHPVDLPVPELPRELDGLRIAHVSDLHVKRWNKRLSQLVNQLTAMRLDLVAFTGDVQHLPPHLDAAVEVMRRITRHLRPAIGSFGVFGNHDEADFVEAVENLPIHWLRNEAFAIRGKPLEIMGLHEERHEQPDAAALALNLGRRAEEPPSRASREKSAAFRILLCHNPARVHAADALGAKLTLCGHTHGGQIRLPWKRSLINSTDLPQWMSSGAFRTRSGLLCISRGLGESGLPLRTWCPPHMPVYTLRRRTGLARHGDGLHRVIAW
jgi:uncharacterized protein